MEALVILTNLTLILLLGVIFSMISQRLKIPNMLFLLITGMFLGSLVYEGEQYISFPEIFMNGIGILALVMVVFDASSRFKWRDIDTFTTKALKLASLFLFFCFILLTPLAYFILGLKNIFFAMIFAVLMAGTSPSVMLTILKDTAKQNKVTELLQIESIINTPLTVLLPFLILDFITSNKGILSVAAFKEQFIAFIQQFIIGIGTGVLLGLIVFKFMRKYYSEKISPLILITTALLTYILSENLSGNGVLAVTVLGLFFGNLYVKEKFILHEFSEMLANSLMILVFVLIGLKIQLDYNLVFFLRAFLLFAVYVSIRLLTIILLFKEEYNLKEKLFLSLNIPKGIATAVVAFTLSSFVFLNFSDKANVLFSAIPDGKTILNTILIFMLYSLVISTIITHFSKYFIRVDIEKNI